MQLLSMLSFFGIILMILGISMLLPVLPGLYYGDTDWNVFLFLGLFILLIGFIVNKTTLRFKDELHLREALALVTLSWFLASLVSTIPYLLTNTFDNFTDAFFESMAGFTTTGTTVIPDLTQVSHSVLFWRSLTHWLGGMGIIVLFIALMSTLKVGGGHSCFGQKSRAVSFKRLNPGLAKPLLFYGLHM